MIVSQPPWPLAHMLLQTPPVFDERREPHRAIDLGGEVGGHSRAVGGALITQGQLLGHQRTAFLPLKAIRVQLRSRRG